MIYLSNSATSSSVKGFWIALSLFAIGLAGLIYQFLLPSPYFVAGCLLAALVFAGVLVRYPTILQASYKAVGAVIRNRLIPAARCWVLGVVFCLVILANRPFRRTVEAASDCRDTTWVPKEIYNLIGGSRSQDVVVAEEESGSWITQLCGWIKEKENWWVIGLIPFMLLLSILDVGSERGTQSTETYTLF